MRLATLLCMHENASDIQNIAHARADGNERVPVPSRHRRLLGVPPSSPTLMSGQRSKNTSRSLCFVRQSTENRGKKDVGNKRTMNNWKQITLCFIFKPRRLSVAAHRKPIQVDPHSTKQPKHKFIILSFTGLDCRGAHTNVVLVIVIVIVLVIVIVVVLVVVEGNAITLFEFGCGRHRSETDW